MIHTINDKIMKLKALETKRGARGEVGNMTKLKRCQRKGERTEVGVEREKYGKVAGNTNYYCQILPLKPYAKVTERRNKQGKVGRTQ